MVVAVMVTAILVLARPGQVPPSEANPWPARGEVTLPAELPGVYVVRPGDTLWDIARAAAPGTDPRMLVQELAEAAGGAALEPGQQIILDADVAAAVASGTDRLLAQSSVARAAGADR